MSLLEFLEKESSVKRVVFDFDSTLARLEVDWNPWHEIMAKIIQKYDPTYEYSFGKRVDFDLSDNIRVYGDSLRQELWEANFNYESAYIRELTPNPELMDFLELDSDFDVHLFTSNSRITIEKALKSIGLIDRFGKVITRDEVDYIKPDPQGFSLIYDPAFPKSEYAMVGDSINDEVAAEKFGIGFYKIEGVDWDNLEKVKI